MRAKSRLVCVLLFIGSENGASCFYQSHGIVVQNQNQLPITFATQLKKTALSVVSQHYITFNKKFSFFRFCSAKNVVLDYATFVKDARKNRLLAILNMKYLLLLHSAIPTWTFQEILPTRSVLLFHNGCREFHFDQAKRLQNVFGHKELLCHFI